MPRFAANLSLMYTEFEFLDRFAAAAKDGFRAVEFQFPYTFNAHDIKRRLDDNGLQLVLFNAPPGGQVAAEAAQAWERGDRGTACRPERKVEFEYGLGLALHYAELLQCPQIHVMAGCALPHEDADLLHCTMVANLASAVRQSSGVQWLVEPINTRDVPGYFLSHQEHAHRLVDEVASPHVKVQMDLYHCQVMEGDIASKLRRYLPTGNVGHLQIAGVPGRHEPDTGELNYDYLFRVMDELQYPGWVGCEYRPQRGSVAEATRMGLGWLATSARSG